MSVRDYVKSAAGDYLIVALMAVSLAYAVTTGFYAGDSGLAATIAQVATILVLLAAMYAAAFNKRTLLPGCIAIAVVVVAGLAVVAAVQGAPIAEDAEGNVFLVEALGVVVGVAVFLLTRTRPGLAVCAVAGCVAMAVVEYLYLELHVVPACLFVLGCAMQAVFGYYRGGLAKGSSAKASFGSAWLMAAGASVAAAAVALAAAYCVLAVANPDALDVKLLTEYRALEEVPRRGTSEELAQTDPDMTSAYSDDRINDVARDDSAEREQDTEQRNGTFEGLAESVASIGSGVGYSLESLRTQFNLITYNMPFWGWILAIVLVALALAAPFLVKRWLRARFHRRALEAGPREYAVRLYQRFVRDFERMGVPRAASLTPYEFSVSAQQQLAGFADNAANAGFPLITSVFVKAGYSREPVGESEVLVMRSFYDAFYRNCRKQVGTLKYVLLYLRL